MNVKFFQFSLLVFIAISHSDESLALIYPCVGESVRKIKTTFNKTENGRADGNATLSVSKTWTATFQDILATMNEKDRKELEGKMKREKFKLDMTDIKYDIYADVKTGATFAIPFGENFQFSDGTWFNCGYASGPGMDTLQYSILYSRASSFQESLSTINSIIENKFSRKLWKETASNVATSDPTQTSIVHRYEDKLNKFGQIDAEVSDSVYLVVSLTYNGYLLDHDAAYLKKFYQYSMALYMASFTKY